MFLSQVEHGDLGTLMWAQRVFVWRLSSHLYKPRAQTAKDAVTQW